MKYLINITLIILVFACSQKKFSITGEKAPQFLLPLVPSGTYNSDQFKGKMVLLHFWADWCASCRAEFPKLQNAYEQLSNENFEIVAINSGQTHQHVQEFIDQYNITFPMLFDASTDIAKKYEVRGLPMNFFIGTDGIIKKIVIGWVDEKQVKNIVQDIKEGKI